MHIILLASMWRVLFEKLFQRLLLNLLEVMLKSMLDFENAGFPNLLLFTFVSHPVTSDTLDYIV